MSKLSRLVGFATLAIVLLLAGSALADDTPPPTPVAVGGVVLFAWITLSAIVNTVAHYATPQDVDAWAERQPRLARLLGMIRRAGFEPVAFVQDLYNFVAANPPPLGHGSAIGRAEPSFVRPPTVRPPPLPGRGFAELRALPLMFVLACGLLPAVVPGATALGICVVDFVKANPGLTLIEYTAQAILTCGGDALAILDALIASTDPAVASLQAEAKALKAAGGPKLQAFVGSVHARAGAIRSGEPK